MNAALPQYEFTELIGAGGMGAVYKARQPKLNRFVAIKILPPIPDDELGFAERFEREAQSMAQLSHPHIVSVYDFGETSEGQLYFVMEYVEGADLHQLITGSQLTLDHFYGWIPQVCEAVQYAHDRGIVHRDIKPANILIDTEGRVKIADFGLAKLTGDHPQTALTMADISMGTPDYAAPEQLDGGHEVDWRSDIYSLGVVMYQMLTGRLPRGAFPLPSETDEALDVRLDEVVIHAMQSLPDSRFQRASEIAEQLSEIRSTVHRPIPEVPVVESSVTSSGPRVKKQFSSLLPLVGGLVAISAAAGLLFLFLGKDKREERRQAIASKVESIIAPENPVESPEPVEAPKPKPMQVQAPEPGPSVTGKPPLPKGNNPPTGADKPPLDSAGMPPRDFSRRGQTNEKTDNRPNNFASFRDKLGRKSADFGRRNQANLTIVSRTPDGFQQAGPLVEIPEFMIPLSRLAIGQSPVQVDDGHRFALGIQVDGRLVSWGDNSRGQLDFPPEAATGVEIAAGAFHALAVHADGKVSAWGANDAGQCEVPKDLSGAVSVAAGKDFSIALTSNGKVIAWGGSSIADLPEDLGTVTAISAGYTHAAALREDGTVVTWGTNEFDQLTMPPNLEKVMAVTCNFGNTFALREDGGVVSWGVNGKNATLPDAEITEIYGSGDSLIARDRDERLIVLGKNGSPAPIPGFLRQVPDAVRVQFAGPLIFAWRPVEMSPGESQPTKIAEPVVPETSQTEAGLAIAEKLQIFEETYPKVVVEPWEASITQLNEFYLTHLEERQAEAAANKNLEEAVAWRDEAERIRSGEPLPETDAPDLPPALRDLRQTYRLKAQEHEQTRVEAETILLSQFENALQQLQDQFTAEQKLDEALEVKAFIERRKEQ